MPSYVSDPARRRFRLLEALFTRLPSIAYVVGADGRFLEANPRALEALGVGAEEVSTSTLEALASNEVDATNLRLDLEQVVRERRGVHRTVVLGKDAPAQVYEHELSPVIDGDELVGALGIAGPVATPVTTDERARRILESISDAFFSLDRDFRFSYLNETARRFLRRDDLVGKSLWEEFPAARGTEFQRAYEHAMHRGERVDFTAHYPAPLDRWYDVRAYPSVEGISVFFQDITERRHAEIEHERQRAQLELVVRGADVGVWYCPLPFDELIWDAKVKEHFHLPPDARVTIETFYERLHPEDRERTREAIQKSVERHEAYDIDYRTVSPDGQRTKWIRALGSTFYDDAGKPIRFDGVTSDVTERKRVERDRERVLEAERAARSEVERQSRMKDEFLTTLSHELRTPLNAILGWSQLLATRHRDQPELSKTLEVVIRNARLQVRLIDDLLDVSRMLSGKLQLETNNVPLLGVVWAAADAARPSAEAKGIRLQVLHGGSEAMEVHGDAARLQQVFGNLLSNAVKFTLPGGEVVVTVIADESFVEVEVADDGEGIEPGFLPFVFERFRQADGSITRKHGGLGLGLSIVKEVVERHRGEVSAASPGVGLGTTMRVRLPRVTVDARPVSPAETAGADVRGLRVLVVDNEHDALVLCRSILEEAGADVVTASSAAEGIAMLAGAARFDVLVTDIGMPEQDGYTFLKQVRAGAKTRYLPAIALTAYARAEDRQQALTAGFHDHVVKPVDPLALRAAVAGADRSRG